MRRWSEGDTIQASWTAAEDYYLYRDRISFASGTPGVELGEPVYPAGKLKLGLKPDGSQGEVETYTHTVTIAVPITASVPGPFKLIAHGPGMRRKTRSLLSAPDPGKGAGPGSGR